MLVALIVRVLWVASLVGLAIATLAGLAATLAGLAATLISVLQLDGSGTNGEESGDEAAHCRSCFC